MEAVVASVRPAQHKARQNFRMDGGGATKVQTTLEEHLEVDLSWVESNFSLGKGVATGRLLIPQ